MNFWLILLSSSRLTNLNIKTKDKWPRNRQLDLESRLSKQNGTIHNPWFPTTNLNPQNPLNTTTTPTHNIPSPLPTSYNNPTHKRHKNQLPPLAYTDRAHSTFRRGFSGVEGHTALLHFVRIKGRLREFFDNICYYAPKTFETEKGRGGYLLEWNESLEFLAEGSVENEWMARLGDLGSEIVSVEDVKTWYRYL